MVLLIRTAARLVGGAALGVLVASAPVLADQDGAALIDPGEPAIPPGQEELLAVMLGKGATLPGACEFTDGQTRHSTITATYACKLGVVVLELVHARQAEPISTQTEQFAIAVESGSPPESLTDAVAALIRSRESEFEWAWNTAPAAPDSDDTGIEEDEDAVPGTSGWQ